MSVNYSFFDDQLIGVDELNKITSRVFADGVVREVSSVSDLNGFVTDIATAGVVPQSCDSLKVTVNNDIITINKGTAFFSDGTVIEITEPESFPCLAGTTQFVYLISDKASNRAYVDVLNEEAPYEVNILLAIVKNGEVTDKRMYARSKLAYYASSDVNNNVFVEEDDIEKKYTKDEDGYINLRVNVNMDMYKYIQILDKNSFNFTRYNVKSGKYLCFGYGNASYYQLNETVMIAASKRKQRCACIIEKGEGYVNFKLRMEDPGAPIIPLSLKLEFIA